MSLQSNSTNLHNKHQTGNSILHVKYAQTKHVNIIIRREHMAINACNSHVLSMLLDYREFELIENTFLTVK